MIDLYSKMVDEQIPFENFQFDSWWYFKGKNGGVKLWEPITDIFPNGMEEVHARMGNIPLALHNRYFSPDNDYIPRNYDFIVEE